MDEMAVMVERGDATPFDPYGHLGKTEAPAGRHQGVSPVARVERAKPSASGQTRSRRTSAQSVRWDASVADDAAAATADEEEEDDDGDVEEDDSVNEATFDGGRATPPMKLFAVRGARERADGNSRRRKPIKIISIPASSKRSRHPPTPPAAAATSSGAAPRQAAFGKRQVSASEATTRDRQEKGSDRRRRPQKLC
ncbi:unnamed protein product [Lampetra fluviatilis]